MKLQKLLIAVLFIGLMGYLILRAFTVFYIHDEIVTIWAYMIDWNPFPYQGYLDANNHFLNSLLGGFFIRLFQSDEIWVTRLPNLLSFPLYFYAIVAFHRFFKSQFTFYFFLISLSCTPFILDFFSLARGYGMAWAFFIWSLYQAFCYLENQKTKHLILFLTASVICLYANLSLLSAVIVVFGVLFSFKLTAKEAFQKKIKHLLYFFMGFVLIAYAIDYALELKSAGKLYMGAATNFFTITIEPLAIYLYNLKGDLASISISLLFLAILSFTFFNQVKRRQLFSLHAFFPILLTLSILAILAQNVFIDVNFPENRSAAYLIFLFFGSLAFTLDRAKWKPILILLSLFHFTLFLSKANFSHTLVFKNEHYDLELLTKIPERVKGIPPSTAGVYFNQDNAMSRLYKLPVRAIQAIVDEPFILEDYLIEYEKMDSVFKEYYHVIHVDPISKLALFERNNFLERTKLFEQSTQFSGFDEFVNLMDKRPSIAGFVRCKGVFKNMTKQNQSVILFTQVNSESDEKLAYGGISPVTSAPINEDGTVEFDFTYTMMDFIEADQMSVYIFNKEKLLLEGEVTISFYSIE